MLSVSRFSDKNKNCEGFVTDPSGKVRECNKTGNFVFDNGYCDKHQTQASEQILLQLKLLKKELDSLLKIRHESVDTQRIQLAQKEIEKVETRISKLKNICFADPECQAGLRNIFTNVRSILSPGGEGSGLPDVMINDTYGPRLYDPLTNLSHHNEMLGDLSLATRGDNTLAARTVRDSQLAENQKENNDKNINRWRHGLSQASHKAQEEESKFQRGMSEAHENLKTNTSLKKRALGLQQNLQEALNRCQVDSVQLSGGYSETIESLKNDVDRYKTLAEKLAGREVSLHASIKTLTESEEKVQEATLALKNSYEDKIQSLQDDYATKANSGAIIRTDREKELEDYVEQLKTELEKAIKDLEVTGQASREALDHMESIKGPQSDVSEQFMLSASNLRQANKKLAETTAELDNCQDRFSKNEASLSRRLEQGVSQANIGRDKTMQENSELSQRISDKTREIADLQRTVATIKNKANSKFSAMKTDVRSKTVALENSQRQLSEERLTVSNAKRLNSQILRSQQETNDAEFRQLKEEWRQKVAAKISSLRDTAENDKRQIEAKNRELVVNRGRMTEIQKALNKQRADLDKYQGILEHKMADFSTQKERLQSELRESQDQTARFTSLENDHKKRINNLRQSLEVSRHRYESQITDLKKRLATSLNARATISSNLQQCSAARESILARANLATEDKDRWRDKYLQLKSRHEIVKADYERKTELMINQATKIKNSLSECDSRLQDVSLVHDHVQRLTEENRQIRLESQEEMRQLKDRGQAMQKLLTQRSLASQEVSRLQNAIKQCSAGQTVMKSRVESTNQQLRDLHRMNGSLTGEMRSLSTQYQQELLNRESQMSREKRGMQTRENQMRGKIGELNLSREEMVRRNDTLRKQKESTENTLADTVVNNAYQVQSMVDAERISARTGQEPKARSSLINI
jgi:chromosome segregation ATPase